MKAKAVLILLGILVGVGLLVGLLLYGSMRNNEKTAEMPLPGADAAKQFVLDKGLLANVQETSTLRSGGPVFLELKGTDGAGVDKTVWVAGKSSQIKEYGAVLTQDGVSRESILAKLKDKGITEDQVRDLFITPYDYTSGKITWFFREKGDRKHMIWFDYTTGEQVWEGYEDPTAWKLTGN
ncbi:hypothetical protein [Gorillibacterium massiliense]|uniref:hypothetical protein n=1 Tax=Gorillibacterium massiliense TaxID=1280390 RepID=UPI0004B16350|nr:hypothetical protein [Gorillibacterium massiliense]